VALQVRWLGGSPPLNLDVEYGTVMAPTPATTRKLSMTGEVRKLSSATGRFGSGTLLNAFRVELHEFDGALQPSLSFFLSYNDTAAASLNKDDYVAVGLGWAGDISVSVTEVFRGIITKKREATSTLGTKTWGYGALSLAELANTAPDDEVKEERILIKRPKTGDNANRPFWAWGTAGVVPPTVKQVIESLKPTELTLRFLAEDFALRALETRRRTKLAVMSQAAYYGAATLGIHGTELIVRGFKTADEQIDFIYTDDEMFQLQRDESSELPIGEVTVLADDERPRDFSVLSDADSAAVLSGRDSPDESRPNRDREQVIIGRTTTILESIEEVWRPEAGLEMSSYPPDPLLFPMKKTTYDAIRLYPEMIVIDPPDIEMIEVKAIGGGFPGLWIWTRGDRRLLHCPDQLS